VLAYHGYTIRTEDTDSYNCREITGGTGKSLHSYGIALDINWKTNPYLDHEGQRPPRFSNKPTQEQRALDVKHGLADTDMTSTMIADALAIKTVQGLTVFEWGGNWQTVKDAMHFEIDLSPVELTAIDWPTVRGGDLAPDNTAGYPGVPRASHRVLARRGLNIRGGPGLEFPVVGSVAFGTFVTVVARLGLWALVDVQGDGGADGHVHSSYLEAI
jgi:hypothetical protein